MAEENLESFEAKLERLQTIVNQLESGTLPLDQGMALYREGMRCSKDCKALLENAKHELTQWKNEEEISLDLGTSSEVSAEKMEKIAY